MSDQIRTNSAIRLHKLLAQLKGQGGPNLNLIRILPKVLRTQQEDNNVAVLDAIAIVYQMFRDVEREIDSSFEEIKKKDFYKKSLPSLRAAFSPMSFGANWDNHKVNLKDTDLVALEHVGVVLEDLVQENFVPEQPLSELLVAIDEIASLFRQSSLPRTNHLFFMDLLENLRMAVQEYERRGAEGLKEALAAYMGGLALGQSDVNATFDADQKSKIWSVVGRASDVITLAQATWVGFQLAAPASEVIHKLISSAAH